MASDGGSGVLILRGATGRLLSKSAQPNKVPLASKTSTDSADACFAVPGFHLTMRPSTNPFLLSTLQPISEERSAPKRRRAGAVLSEEAPAEDRVREVVLSLAIRSSTRHRRSLKIVLKTAVSTRWHFRGSASGPLAPHRHYHHSQVAPARGNESVVRRGAAGTPVACARSTVEAREG